MEENTFELVEKPKTKWHYDAGIQAVQDDHGFDIADVMCDYGENGPLIAAAPDMRNALEMLIGVLDDCRRGTEEGNIPPGILDRFDEATNVCRAALKKARGEA